MSNKENSFRNISLARQSLLANLILEELNKTQNDYIMIPIDLFRGYILLSDFSNLEIILEKISHDNKENFSFRIMTRDVVSSAADYEMRNPSKIPVGIKIIINDRKKFKGYAVELDKKSKEEENAYTFILSDDYKLTIEGNELNSYKMKKDSIRYKIIYSLAKAQKEIETNELAEKVGTSADRIRKTVGQIRKIVQKELNIPEYSLIKNNNDNAGYYIKNITFSTSKG